MIFVTGTHSGKKVQVCISICSMSYMQTAHYIFAAPGPYIGLKNFHYSMLAHCSLHNVNLGVCQDATGSTLHLVALYSGETSMDCELQPKT